MRELHQMYNRLAPYGLLLLWLGNASTGLAQIKAADAERARVATKQQFVENFRNLQLTSQQLKREHEKNALTPAQLAKLARGLQRNAKTLRSLMALGEVLEPPNPDHFPPPDSPKSFHETILQTAQTIYDFAHSPFHKNSKVYDMREAEKIHQQLLIIVILTKNLEGKAEEYRTKPHNH